MGKISKASKPIAVAEKKPKVKKLKNAGVSKASNANSKLNLKEARGPLLKIVKDETTAKGKGLDAETLKSLKTKKNVSKPTKGSSIAKPKSQETSNLLTKKLGKKESLIKSANATVVKTVETRKADSVLAADKVETLVPATKKAKAHIANGDPKSHAKAGKKVKVVANDAQSQQAAVGKKARGKIVPNDSSENQIVTIATKKLSKTKAGKKATVDGAAKKTEVVKKQAAGKKRKLQEKDEADVADSDKEAEPADEDDAKIDSEQVAAGIKAVLKLIEQSADKSQLFDGEHQPIFLQVTAIKVAKVPTRQLRMVLPHTLVTDTDEVALFVPDLERGRRQDSDKTVNHYKDLLEKHGCTRIKEVIPMNQVKTEFDQYELKRKLLGSYDYFLTDGSIAGHMSHVLGKVFYAKRKLPTPIRLRSKDLKHEIDHALRKTSMQLHASGNCNFLQVAHSLMPEDKILENVLSVAESLAKNYPGGWANVRSLLLKSSNSLAIPIYATLKSKNKVKVPVVLAKRPKAYRTVAGELSTDPGNVTVLVRPDGTVDVVERRKNNQNKKAGEPASKKKKLNDDTSAAAKGNKNKKGTDAAEPEKDVPGKKKQQKQKAPPAKPQPKVEIKKEKKGHVDSEDEIEQAEQAYLSQWQQQSDGSDAEEAEKKPKVIKKKTKKTIKKKLKS